MMTVTYDEYMKDLKAFTKKHPDFTVRTSGFTNETYHKSYIAKDGEFTEINEHAHWDEITGTSHGITYTLPVQVIRHEYWSTDNPTSKYWYEKR